MSCLFDSVSSYTKNCPSPQLRIMVSDYLKGDPVFWDTMNFGQVFPMFAIEDVHGARSVEEYVERMRLDHTWGGAIEIQAMCNMFSISIRIHVMGGKQPIVFLPAAATRSPTIEHTLDITWNGCHFEPLPFEKRHNC